MRFAFVCLIVMVGDVPAWAGLGPNDVFLIVNKNEPRSREVADHYCKVRGVPTDHIVTLELPIGDDITRADYQEKMVKPLRIALRTRARQVKVLLSIYGVPLRVGPAIQTEDEKKEVEEVEKRLTENRRILSDRRDVFKGIEEVYLRVQTPSMKATLDKLQADVREAEKDVESNLARIRALKHVESEAAVDSELMLLWWPPYPTERWVFNPLYNQFPSDLRRSMPPVLMTCRLDGTTVEMAKRLVDDAMAVEAKGLEGKVYVDARGIKYDPALDVSGTGYGGYDEAMRELARLLDAAAVTLDDQEALFPPHSCPDFALYCGWYSVRNYVPCCKFNKGAVAWHLASFEMVSLRRPGTMWCGNLLAAGACATLGPVAEPYTVAFPKPAEFFGTLMTGEYTLVECYSRTVMLTSWMMTLVGDPLYNPYKKSPKLKAEQVRPSPRESKFLINHQ